MNDIVCGVYVHVCVCMYVTGLWLCMCMCVYVSLGCGPTPSAVFLLFGAVHVPSIDLTCTTNKNYTLGMMSFYTPNYCTASHSK